MRIYELAKELGENSTDLRKKLKNEFDLDFPSHMSAIDDEYVKLIREFYDKEDEETELGNNKKFLNEKSKKKGHKFHIEDDEYDEIDVKKDRKHKKKSNKQVSEKMSAADESSQPEKQNKAENHNKQDKKGNKNKSTEDKPQETSDEDFAAIIEIPSEITVGDFAKAIKKNSMEVIGELIRLGVMAGLNESITFETAEIVAEKFGILITEPEESDVDEIFQDLNTEDDEKDLKSRPPVVTVMGHVDHGKTSILDAIRESAVTRGEAGGITQHIGASVAKVNGKTITFIDTPGHEAFTQMRSRGAKTTDIVVLVVAADDGVMPQTVEAINHAKAAGVPIIVAINKMDKYEANPDRVKQELAEYNLIPEDWGGDTIMIPVSAHTKQGVDELLQMILMLAEMEELKANPDRHAIGVVIESQLEKGMGATASILVQKGTLTDKDYVVSGQVSGHIRSMFDSMGKKIKKAGPSTPVKIIGLSDLPEAGDMIYSVADEKIARSYAQKAALRNRDERLNRTTHISLDDLHVQISEDGLKELNIIVKTDVKGTIDALASSIEKLSNEEVKVNIIHGAVGGISESDVMLAAASNAIIIGFNVRPNQGAIAQADRESIELRTYRVIYDAIDDIEQAIKGMLAPTFKEEVLGRAEIRDTFRIPGGLTIAGIYVTSGKMLRNAKIRLLRNDIVIYEGQISSLRRFKDDVKEVAQGYEGGLGIEGYNDVKVGDFIECFHDVEVAR